MRQNSLGVQPMPGWDFSSPLHLRAAAGEIPPSKSERGRVDTTVGKGLGAKFGCGHPVWGIKEFNSAVTGRTHARWPRFQRTGLGTFNLDISKALRFDLQRCFRLIAAVGFATALLGDTISSAGSEKSAAFQVGHPKLVLSSGSISPSPGLVLGRTAFPRRPRRRRGVRAYS